MGCDLSKQYSHALEGFAECAFGWMADYKGFWYHKTEQGCSSGVGFRDANNYPAGQGPVGAYCCHPAPAIQRKYVGGLVSLPLVWTERLLRLVATTTQPEMLPRTSAKPLDTKDFAHPKKWKARRTAHLYIIIHIGLARFVNVTA